MIIKNKDEIISNLEIVLDKICNKKELSKEKEKLIKESRLLINTSIWEGIPISWLEALQYGTLIVSCLDNENLPSKFGVEIDLRDSLDGNIYLQHDPFLPGENFEEFLKNYMANS